MQTATVDPRINKARAYATRLLNEWEAVQAQGQVNYAYWAGRISGALEHVRNEIQAVEREAEIRARCDA